jgi:hypothetical protein
MHLLTKSIRAAAAFAAALLIISACSSSTSSEPFSATRAESTRALLLGTWKLERACGGITGGCRDIATVDAPTRYVFRADDMVLAYRGQTLAYAISYLVLQGAASPAEGDVRAVLLIGLGPTVDPVPLRIDFPDENTLLIDEGCCDRYTYEYSRVR